MLTDKAKDTRPVKSSELRIGNILKDSDGKEYAVSGHCIYSLTVIENRDLSANNFMPIPLSEEWLLKFGFTKHDKGWFWKNWGKNGTVIIVWMEPYKKYGIQLGQHKTKVVNYVHELQNGFNFLASGEELTLKN